jgi:hypothetical protein
MYCISTFIEFWWNVHGHIEIMYRFWYLIGAIFVAAYLGQGTLYLLVRRKIAHIIMAVLGIVSVYAAYRVFSINIDISSLTELTGVGIFPSDIRAIVTPIFNGFGTLALIGGAIYSAVIFWRRRILPHRVTANILIAFGALLPAIGGTNISVGGNINLFFLFELVGVIIIFIGFLRANKVFGLSRFPLIHGFRKVKKT